MLQVVTKNNRMMIALPEMFIAMGIAADAEAMSLKHVEAIAHLRTSFLIVNTSAWAVLHVEQPELYSDLYSIMMNAVPRNRHERFNTRLRSLMSTYEALDTFYFMVNQCYRQEYYQIAKRPKTFSAGAFNRLAWILNRKNPTAWEA